jgi:hypothetical protein
MGYYLCTVILTGCRARQASMLWTSSQPGLGSAWTAASDPEADLPPKPLPPDIGHVSAVSEKYRS